MKAKSARAPASVDNIYKLDGRVPVGEAIPFGLQHELAMFVANVTPVMLIASVAVYNGQAGVLSAATIAEERAYMTFSNE